jgi:hypothetical protein
MFNRDIVIQYDHISESLINRIILSQTGSN